MPNTYNSILTGYNIEDIPKALADRHGKSYEIAIMSIKQVNQTLILKERS